MTLQVNDSSGIELQCIYLYQDRVVNKLLIVR